MKRLVRRRKRQPIARRLHEIQRLGLKSASELANELVLCIAALPGRSSDVGNVVTSFEPLTVWSGFQNCPGAVVADDVEAFGCVGVVVLRWIRSWRFMVMQGEIYLVRRRRCLRGFYSR